MSTPARSSAGVPLYSMQISRAALKRWAQNLPREVGGALITEALTELVRGDCGALKSLPFVSRLNARRRKRRQPSIAACACLPPNAVLQEQHTGFRAPTERNPQGVAVGHFVPVTDRTSKQDHAL